MKKKPIKKNSEIREAIDKDIARGWKMSKIIHKGYYNQGGFFDSGYQVPATYDERIIYTREDLIKLNKEGFLITENMPEKMTNILLSL